MRREARATGAAEGAASAMAAGRADIARQRRHARLLASAQRHREPIEHAAAGEAQVFAGGPARVRTADEGDDGLRQRRFGTHWASQIWRMSSTPGVTPKRCRTLASAAWCRSSSHEAQLSDGTTTA